MSETVPDNHHEAADELRRYFTVIRVVTVIERWYHIEAASEDEALVLLEDGLIERDPDKEDSYPEWIEADEEEASPKAGV